MKNNEFFISHWWAVVLRGLLALGLGLVFIMMPGKSLLTIVSLVGLLMVLDGVIAAIMGLVSVHKNERWWVLLVQGVLGVLLGMILFNWPKVTVGLLFFILAIWIIFSGILTMVLAVAMRRESYGNWTVMAIGVIGILFGLLLFSYPTQSVQVVVVLFGIYTLISGIMGIAYGMDLRRIGKDLAKA